MPQGQTLNLKMHFLILPRLLVFCYLKVRNRILFTNLFFCPTMPKSITFSSGRARLQKLGEQGEQNAPQNWNFRVLLHFYVTISESWGSNCTPCPPGCAATGPKSKPIGIRNFAVVFHRVCYFVMAVRSKYVEY